VIKKFQKSFVMILIFLGLMILVLIALIKPQKHIKIPPENFQKTTGWKIYENKEYHFSFKYPDFILSNFEVNTQNKTTTSLKEMTQFKKTSPQDKTTTQNTPYNVIFEADAWKSESTLSDFLKKGYLKETAGFERQTIMLGDLVGYRISNINIGKKTDVYFYYNLFKRGNYVYNFVLLSDDPVLILGNKELLDEIIATTRFY
jgi:hypothetical protein